MRTPAAVLSLLLAAAPPGAWGLSVLNSKHDLSARSATTGPKAATETDTCVFCHAAHRPAAVNPLWNRADSPVTFTFYSSNYLNSYLGQAAPTMTDLQASRTKLCLSCHDGVTALGALYNLAPNTLEMTGSMNPASIVGADLSNDHPVLYDVRPGAGPPTQPGTDPEIRLPPPGDPVRVYGAGNRVECTSCHDAHNNRYGSFLIKPNANAALCTTCHQKTNYGASAHGASNALYTPPGGTPTTVKEWSCRSCHKAHGAALGPYLLAASEEAACYQCHGNPPLPGAKDVKSQYAKGFRHPTESVAGVHVNPETDASNLGPGRRHAECYDCHNPHQAQPGAHVAPTNTASNALLGQWGVEPSWAATPWTMALSYNRRVFTNSTGYKEYQLCLKCHSSYAFGQTPPAAATDAAVELNPNNRSAHPVRDGLNAQTGSGAPKALAAAQLSAPFAANPGGQTMACSDCHGSDAPGDPAGPHGSAGARLLKGPRKFWPTNATGGLWTLNDVKNNANNWSGDLFCVNCHPLYSGGTWKNEVHDRHESRTFGGAGIKCIVCHVVVPHGAKRSRLIGYADEPAPYNHNGAGTYDKLLLQGFKKAAEPFNYSMSNCNVSCHGGSSGGSGYDP